MKWQESNIQFNDRWEFCWVEKVAFSYGKLMKVRSKVKKKKIPLRHIIDTEEHEGWVFNNKYVPHWSEHSGAWAGTRQFSWGQCWRVRTHLSKIMALPSRFILLVRISDCHHYCLFWMVTPSLSYLGYPQDGRPERAPPGVAVSDTGILPSDWPLP